VGATVVRQFAPVVSEDWRSIVLAFVPVAGDDELAELGEIPVTLPILPVLQRTLDAGPTGDLSFICGKNGKPFTKESFGNAFKKACVKAGLPNRSAHGCRKIAATRAAENGATVAELNAIFGWTGSKMASHYTEAADRKRLALGAISKLDANQNRTSIVAPIQKVRQRRKPNDFQYLFSRWWGR